jgi:hypothetical protein
MSEASASLVPPQFKFLIDEYGFRIVGGEVSASFDNMYVDLTNDSVNVQLVREVGFVSADVGSPAAPTLWLPLRFLRQLVLRHDPAEDVTLHDEAEFLRSHLSTITGLLSEANLKDTEARVIEVGRARSKKLFPGSVREE